jgi:hypothetical protein
VTQSAIACILEAIKSIRCATREAYGQLLELVSRCNRLRRFTGVTWRGLAKGGAICSEGGRAEIRQFKLAASDSRGEDDNVSATSEPRESCVQNVQRGGQ